MHASPFFTVIETLFTTAILTYILCYAIYRLVLGLYAYQDKCATRRSIRQTEERARRQTRMPRDSTGSG